MGIKNTSTVININTTGDKGQQNTSHIPDAILEQEYLVDYLNSLDIPHIIDDNFLSVVKKGALKAKISDVEAYNMAFPKLKKKMPDRFDFDEVAVIMMTLYTFKSIQMTDRDDDTILAMYVNNTDSKKYGTYMSNTKYLFEIMEMIAPSFKNRDMQDVIDKIERSAKTVEQTKDKHLYAVNNGIYNSKTHELMPFSPDYVYLTKIPVDYKPQVIVPVITAPDGYQWDVESWIADLTDNDADTTTLIWQVIADCLQPNYSRNKSIWFYSEKGNNGKGTIGQLIKNLLGKGNYASLSVADFKHEFLKSTLLGVAANIADENDVDMYIDSVKDYKASITGDDININQKYEKPLRLQLLCTNIQMMNGLPKTKDRSDSFYRRLIIVPFLKSFTNNGERTYIKSDYINRREVLEYVLHKALNMDFDEYIVPARSAELLSDYKEKNNPVLEFWNDLKDEFVWDLLPTTFLYDLYKQWNAINNPSGKPMSSRSFIDTLRTVIQADGRWEDKTDRNGSVGSSGRMDADEPLITTYGLDQPDKSGKPSRWMNPSYNGTNAQMRRKFNRSNTYRGFVRL